MTATKALWVRLEAKVGKEKEVAEFLRSAVSLVAQEPNTSPWFALQIGPTSYAIFDAFPDEDARQAHLSGAVAQALGEHGGELFSVPPEIMPIDVLAHTA